MVRIEELPNEVLQTIFSNVDPKDLGILPHTCRSFHDFITGNRLLHKEVYLRTWDEPLVNKVPIEVDWVGELQNLTKFRLVMQSDNLEDKRDLFDIAYPLVRNLMERTLGDPGQSANIEFLAQCFESDESVDALLCCSSLYEYGGTYRQIAFDDEEDRQRSAQLHCLYGRAAQRRRPKALSIHPHARSRVYDLRNYTTKTRWGPFRKDGSMCVDWEMVEAIMVDIGSNLSHIGEVRLTLTKLMEDAFGSYDHKRSIGFNFKQWDTPFWGASPYSFVNADFDTPAAEQVPTELDLQDPFKIAGTWLRVVCYLDYSDLMRYNFMAHQPDPEEPRPPLDTIEEVPLIAMDLHVTGINPAEPGDETDMPVVKFEGTARTLQPVPGRHGYSLIKGNVRMGKEGLPHWSTVSILAHEGERWRSEGVQVGGIDSGRGVLGTWFDVDYDQHGPAGPTAFWKLCDKGSAVGKRKESSTSLLEPRRSMRRRNRLFSSDEE